MERYIHSREVHNTKAAREVLPIVFGNSVPASVLDVGCGLATWLSVASELGVGDICGMDGDYVDRSMLAIDKKKFVAADLSKEVSLSRKFDLVICLEVVEHLPELAANQIVKTLTAHGDTILFSAGIPGQGGQNHVNEQWPEYWQEKFERYNFHFHDVIRPIIWNNPNVDWWYKQNIFLVRKGVESSEPVLPIVHPELFTLKCNYLDNMRSGRYGIAEAFGILSGAIDIKLRSLFSREPKAD